MSATTDWRWWLFSRRNQGLGDPISELTAHDRNLQVQLDSSGKATFWMHLLDPMCANVIPHQTAIVTFRNGTPLWSGPVTNADEDSQASSGENKGQDKLSVTAMGWKQILDQRILHTGAEFQAMIGSQTYAGLGTESATQLAYSAINGATFPLMAMDLLKRANIDSPTGIIPGSIYGSQQLGNLTLQQFQNVGQQITNLSNIENGFDFVIDPLRLTFDIYCQQGLSSGFNGYGVNRPNALFTYPGNCTAAKRTQDGTRTSNRVEATGQYGIGRADDLTSQQQNGLLESNVSLSDVVDPNILIAYANAEVTVKKNPWTVISFNPRGLIASDLVKPGVPRLFDDYWLGDVVYAIINRGPRFQVGTTSTPQPVRVFGATIAIGDDGTEKVSSIQSTYSTAGGA